MTTTALSIKDDIDRLIRKGSIVWDFESSPHLFPVFLFLLFKEKYCVGAIVKGLEMEFPDFNYAFCRCTVTGLPEEYSLWIQIGKIWETATTFTCFIGRKDFVPFKSKEKESSTISFRVHTYDGDAGTEISACCHLRGCDFAVLRKAQEISDEIEREMKKQNLKFQTKAH
jgi:hypothetical protein